VGMTSQDSLYEGLIVGIEPIKVAAGLHQQLVHVGLALLGMFQVIWLRPRLPMSLQGLVDRFRHCRRRVRRQRWS